MKALILSGGGALGAFQVGAEKYAREERGYHWDMIAGVSIGALNGAMLAMREYSRLYKFWSSEVSDTVIYGLLGRWVPTGLLRFLSLYSQRPIRRLVDRELRGGAFQVPLKVGTVSLVTGEYKAFTEQDRDIIIEAVLASAAMPVIWPPVNVGQHDPWMVDGGIRNTSPVGDVLNFFRKSRPKREAPDEVVLINCLPEHPGPLARRPCTLVGIAMRSFDVLINEILLEDVKELFLINALVQQAQKQRVVLTHPRTGRPLEYVQCTVIRPDSPLGNGQDFSRASIDSRLSEGRRKAKEILG